jgi:hypothetical protein
MIRYSAQHPNLFAMLKGNEKTKTWQFSGNRFAEDATALSL